MSGEGKRWTIYPRDSFTTDSDWTGPKVEEPIEVAPTSEVERLRAAIDEALLCLTLIGHAGKTWGEKSNAAKDVLARSTLPDDSRN